MHRVGIIIAEIPPQLIGKKLGPDRWIHLQVIIWSLSAAGRFFMHNRAGFLACRFFLGLSMGDFIRILFSASRITIQVRKCRPACRSFGSPITSQASLPRLLPLGFCI